MRTLPALVFAAVALVTTSANAKQVCGWYAIVFCSLSMDAVNANNKGCGAIIDTNKYAGFAKGQFCLASGPQPKASAQRDRAAALKQGVTKSAYIKRACTDKKNAGD